MSTNQSETEIAKQLLKLNVKKQKLVSAGPYIKRKQHDFYVVNKKRKRESRHETQNGQRTGVYSPKERKLVIQRFMAKRKRRVWTKRRVQYLIRQKSATSRLRVQGRFVKNPDLLKTPIC